MQYNLRKAASGFFKSFLSGEGMVAEFTGPGEILIQTRNLAAFAGLLKPFFPSSGQRRQRHQFRELTVDLLSLSPVARRFFNKG